MTTNAKKIIIVLISQLVAVEVGVYGGIQCVHLPQHQVTLVVEVTMFTKKTDTVHQSIVLPSLLLMVQFQIQIHFHSAR